jgi:choline dehydrogenase
MMVAEKAADLILGNTPLPPEHVPFFRRDPEAKVVAPYERGSDASNGVVSADIG